MAWHGDRLSPLQNLDGAGRLLIALGGGFETPLSFGDEGEGRQGASVAIAWLP